MRIRESEPLEIFTDKNGEIILKKYSPIGELTTHAQELSDVMARVTGDLVCVCDQDQIIAAAGPESKKYMNTNITYELEQLIQRRETVTGTDPYHVVVEDDDHTAQIIVPVICAGDAIGAVVILGENEKTLLGDTELKIATVAADYLAKTMES